MPGQRNQRGQRINGWQERARSAQNGEADKYKIHNAIVVVAIERKRRRSGYGSPAPLACVAGEFPVDWDILADEEVDDAELCGQ